MGGVAALVAALLAIATTLPAHADEPYPTRAVRVLTGYPPGGPSDIMGRVLCDHLTAVLGQPFYLEGKPGAAGNVAGEILANSPPDGHTLYIAGLGNVAVNRDLYKNMAYDPMKAYAPISLVGSFPVILEVNAKLPIESYTDFVAYAKSGKPINYCSPGIGTVVHLAAELLKSRVGFASEHVAYRGTGPFATAMMQGEVEWSFDVPNTALLMSQGNFVRLLGISTATRHRAFPTLPTLVELGVPDFEAVAWFALVAPAATPRPIIARLSAEVANAYKAPEAVERMHAAGLDPAWSTPAETAAIFEKSHALWGKVVRDNNIKAE